MLSPRTRNQRFRLRGAQLRSPVKHFVLYRDRGDDPPDPVVNKDGGHSSIIEMNAEEQAKTKGAIADIKQWKATIVQDDPPPLNDSYLLSVDGGTTTFPVNALSHQSTPQADAWYLILEGNH